MIPLMSLPTRVVAVSLPRRLRQRLAAAAKARHSDVNTLILDAIRADLRPKRRRPNPQKRSQ